MMTDLARVANKAAAAFKVNAQKYGNPLVIAGQNCQGFSRSIQRGDTEFLPEGGGNAAFPDICAYMIAPDAVPALPSPGQPILDAGHIYTVIAVPRPERISGTPIYQTLYAYKSPPPDNATTQSAAEATEDGRPADAGKRVQYHPKSTNT